MNKVSGFSLPVLLILTGLFSCVKEDQSPKPVELDNDLIIKWPAKDSVEQPVPVEVPDVFIPQKVFTTYVSLLSGNEAIIGLAMRDDIDYSCITQGVCWSKSPVPTINDWKMEEESSYKRTPFHITGLELSTTYYLRTFATNSDGIDYGNERSFTTPATVGLVIFNPDLTYGSATDIDGNVYKTINIGTQTWMAENLKTTRYNDGSEIPYVTDNSEWVALKTGAYRWYENDAENYKNLYGALYNWYTVKTGKLCPVGWHVPGDDEWKQLEIALGMTEEEADSWGGEDYGDIGRGTDQGNKMKAISGWTSWEGVNGNGNNSSGFSALPGGDTDWYGWYEIAGQCTSWWTSTQEGSGRVVDSGSGTVGRSIFYAHCGFSVRCLKD
jgi:uncharacterized protein (TIGR02145 family)